MASSSYKKFRKKQLQNATLVDIVTMTASDYCKHHACYSVEYRTKNMTEKKEFCAFLSRKISFIPITHLSYGKEIKDVNGSRELVECNFRQYNFDLEDGIFYLWIKKESEYFKHQESFKIVVDNWQQIPITYETLLLMQDTEITKIYFDLD